MRYGRCSLPCVHRRKVRPDSFLQVYNSRPSPPPKNQHQSSLPPLPPKKIYLIPPKKFPSLIPFRLTLLIALVTSPLAPLARSIASKSVSLPRYPFSTAGKSIDWVWRGISGARVVGSGWMEERERREARRRCLADLAVGLLVGDHCTHGFF